MRQKNQFRKGIVCVIYKKEKNKILYLILKRKLHWKGWEFPKGGTEDKEATSKTILREIKEETGQKPFNIKNHNLKGSYKYKKQFRDRQDIIGQTYKLFSAEIKNKKIKIDTLEHSKYKWTIFKKAIKLLTYPNQRRCLRNVNKYLNN